MNDYTDRILELLKGHTQHKPLRGDDLVAQLRNLDPDTLDAMLDDLQGRGALCRAEITRNGHTYTALWPTGLVPRALSWKDERNNGKGLMGAQLAHNVQQAAEQSRQAVAIPQIPSIPKPIKEEKPMTRIARPAQIVEKVDPAKLVETQHASNRPVNTGRNAGTVQSAVLSVLETGGVLDVDTIFSRLDVPTTPGSTAKILETLAKRGVIEACLKFHNKRHRRFYCMPGTDRYVPDATDPETAATIATLRRIGADDHPADAGKLIDPAEVDPAVFEGLTVDPKAIAREIGAHLEQQTTRAAAVANLESDSTRFALWDNGSLLLTVGDEIVALPRADVRRLANYLRGCAGVLFAEAA